MSLLGTPPQEPHSQSIQVALLCAKRTTKNYNKDLTDTRRQAQVKDTSYMYKNEKSYLY